MLKFFREVKRNKVMFLMLTPMMVYFIIFDYIPMTGIVLAFKTFRIRDGIFGSPWAGLSNFRFLFISGTLWRITLNTLLYNFTFVLIVQFSAMLTAILIHEMAGVWYKKICQQLIFLPYFVSFVILGAFVYNLFNYEFGLLNGYLRQWGMQPVNVYSMPAVWPPIIVFFNTWKWVGYASIVYLATAAGIDPQLYEAAKIDGANIGHRIRFVTLPHFVPAFIILFLLRLGSIMRGAFDLFYNLVGTNSVLFNATDIVETYVFRALTENFDVGLGSAAGLYQSAVSLVLILLANWVVRRVKEDYALF